MARLWGTLITSTTYGTWLRGDARGWVERGEIKPPEPTLEAADRAQLKFPPFRFAETELTPVRDAISLAIQARRDTKVLAITVQTWHVHVVIGESLASIPAVVKCLKDAARWHLRLDRPIWTTGYDKRYCFDERSLLARIAYVERHNH
ncbi:MAG: hypothetical protein JNM18_08200 [Planctomycetaceae bacterium]|nr:hypothetical protein [Planctomycetaceae bacterium]